MAKQELLLVIFYNEEIEDCLSYTLELAKLMKKALSILVVYKKRFFEKLEDYLVASTFAEEGEFDTAKEILSSYDKDFEEKFKLIKNKCNTEGVELKNIYKTSNNILSVIKKLSKDRNSIDIILFSPSISSQPFISNKEIQKIVKELSRPVVAMIKKNKV